MDDLLLERVTSFAPPWVRYVLTLSQMASGHEGYIIANGDDIGLWDADGAPTMPLWPFEDLAAESAEAPAEAVPIGSAELMELMPLLRQNGATMWVFPNYVSDMLVDPEAVERDLTDFTAEPVEVAEQLAAGPIGVEFSDWALLETPEVELPERAEDAGPPRFQVRVDASLPAIDRYADTLEAAGESGWIWLLRAEDAVVGVVVDEQPAMAVFPTKEYANAFAAKNQVPANAEAMPLDAFVEPWLFVAFAGMWGVAVAPAGTSAALVSPVRFALDCGEQVVKHAAAEEDEPAE